MKKLSVLLFSMISVAGCGGGGGSDAASDGLASSSLPSNSESSGKVSLHGNVKVCANASSPKAKVTLPFGAGEVYEVDTDADGNFVLEVDASKFKGVDPVMLAAEAENCTPITVPVGNLASTGSASAGSNGGVGAPPVILDNSNPKEFVVPSPWRPLTHLGNDQYKGPANSQLQVAASGLTTTQPLGTLTQELKDQYKTAEVEFSARGMQTESFQCATQYDNKIGLSATGPSASVAVVKTFSPGASDSNGGYTRFSIPVDLSDFPVGSTLNFVASSGQCQSGGTDYDDFELTNITVRFRK